MSRARHSACTAWRWPEAAATITNRARVAAPAAARAARGRERSRNAQVRAEEKNAVSPSRARCVARRFFGYVGHVRFERRRSSEAGERRTSISNSRLGTFGTARPRRRPAASRPAGQACAAVIWRSLGAGFHRRREPSIKTTSATNFKDVALLAGGSDKGRPASAAARARHAAGKARGSAGAWRWPVRRGQLLSATDAGYGSRHLCDLGRRRRCGHTDATFGPGAAHAVAEEAEARSGAHPGSKRALRSIVHVVLLNERRTILCRN